MMSQLEIGSEFWQAEEGISKSIEGISLYLSGRTALTAILLDLKQRGITSVCIPDYCCASMIEPLICQGLDYRFYPIHLGKQGITYAVDDFYPNEAVMLVDYFGFMNAEMEYLLHKCKDAGLIVVLDQTQAVFSTSYSRSADYIFGSYRKWTGLEVGFARKREDGNLSMWPCNLQGKAYLEKRKLARQIKKEFVLGAYQDELLRSKQLSAFAEAEELLERSYLSGTDEENKELLVHLDRNLLQERRQNNAKVIYEMLPQLKYCAPLFPVLPTDAVPMAVPILVAEGKRNSLRSYLREHGVFCPIHWPLSELHQIGSEAKEIYEKELSLVCDQRYDTEDMAHMMRMMMEWEKTVFK